METYLITNLETLETRLVTVKSLESAWILADYYFPTSGKVAITAAI